MPLLSRKLKNAIIKKAEQTKGIDSRLLHIELKNIRINGQAKGCSGFIGNLESENLFYINTENEISSGLLFREAESLNDYKGGMNEFRRNMDMFVNDIIIRLA